MNLVSDSVIDMLRFTLFNRKENRCMRLEMEEDDTVMDIREIIDDSLNVENYMLCNGYDILDSTERIGDCVKYDDVVNILPDPDLLPL